MATYNFDLLDLADGESGDVAVSLVVGKKKTEAADAKIAAAADTAQPAAQEKPKYSYYTKLQIDEGLRLCQQEQRRLREVLKKLRGEETKLREQPGNEARLKEVSDEQRKLRLKRKKLWEEEETILKPERDAFYKKNGIALPDQDEDSKAPKSNTSNDAADRGSSHNGVDGNAIYNSNDGGSWYSDYVDEYQTQLIDGGEHYQQHGHDERQVERGQGHYNNGDRQQGYRQGHQRRTKQVYVRKVQASSDAGTEAEEKPEENVVSATGTEPKEASADNANDAVPVSESDKSAGGAAQEVLNNGTKTPFLRREKLNGSEKRKKKNAKKNSGTGPDKVKKQDSEVDGSKSADKQPLEEEQKTLAEYEKMREEKKTSEASKTEARKVTAEEFKGLQMLEKKKLDDKEAVIKVEKAQPKVNEAINKKEEAQAEGKDAAAKDGKPKKIVVPHQNLGFRQPRRVTYVQEDGSSARVRFNGGFQGSSRDSSTEPRVNGREEADGHNGNGAPRGAYNGRGDGPPRGDRNVGYGYGRGHGGNQGNAGYQQQRQGGNVGQYQQERAGNGGYYPQRHHPGSGRYYQQRGNSGDRRNSARVAAPPVVDVEDKSKFPALPVPASARSAPAAPVTGQASSAPAAAAPAHAA